MFVKKDFQPDYENLVAAGIDAKHSNEDVIAPFSD